jgi:hypothetical protein
MRKPEELVQTKVRMPEQLRRSIEKRAKKSGRSFSAETVALLEEAMRSGGIEILTKGLEDISRRLARMAHVIREQSGEPTPEEKMLLDRLKDLGNERGRKYQIERVKTPMWPSATPSSNEPDEGAQ